MLLLVAAALVVFLVVYETTLSFREYREGLVGTGRLVLKIALVALTGYILSEAIVQTKQFTVEMDIAQSRPRLNRVVPIGAPADGDTTAEATAPAP